MAKKNRVHIVRTQTETVTITYGGDNPFEIVLVRENAKIRFRVAGMTAVEIVLTKAGLQALIDEASKFISTKVADA